jgi:hypothetical protein
MNDPCQTAVYTNTESVIREDCPTQVTTSQRFLLWIHLIVCVRIFVCAGWIESISLITTMKARHKRITSITSISSKNTS